MAIRLFPSRGHKKKQRYRAGSPQELQESAADRGGSIVTLYRGYPRGTNQTCYLQRKMSLCSIYIALLATQIAIPVNTSAMPKIVRRGRSFSSPSHSAVAAVNTNVSELHTGTAIDISGGRHSNGEVWKEVAGCWGTLLELIGPTNSIAET